jgi:RNA polymerase sigma-70 factor (ECF subfamily)
LQAVDWQIVIKKYGQSVWQTAYRLLDNHTDASDCFQETFICALEVCRTQKILNMQALLVRIVTTRAIDRLRQRYASRKHISDDTSFEVVKSKGPSPDKAMINQEMAAHLRKAIAQLPSHEAEVVCLKYFGTMNYNQIAKELGMNANTVGVLLNRARNRLRLMLNLEPEDI